MIAELEEINVAGHGLNKGRLPFASTGRKVVAEVIAALEAGQLDLPTLPDMAVRIRDSLENPDVSAEKLVHILSTDPVITVHIIKAANSSAFHNGGKVNNLRDAISRLGCRMLYGMVMNITLTKLFRANSLLVDQQLRKLWRHSREVAANCHVLAEQKNHLKPEVAMLAGLVHGIGALPLYLYADRLYMRPDQTMLEELIRGHAATIGPRLLQSWNFPAELVDIVAGHENPLCINDPDIADYVDVLTMANMQTQEATKAVTWKNVCAAERLGYYPGDCRNFFSSQAGQIIVIKGMLGVNVKQPVKPVQSTDAEEVRQLFPHQTQPAKSGLLNSLARLFRQ